MLDPCRSRRSSPSRRCTLVVLCCVFCVGFDRHHPLSGPGSSGAIRRTTAFERNERRGRDRSAALDFFLFGCPYTCRAGKIVPGQCETLHSSPRRPCQHVGVHSTHGERVATWQVLRLPSSFFYQTAALNDISNSMNDQAVRISLASRARVVFCIAARPALHVYPSDFPQGRLRRWSFF